MKSRLSLASKGLILIIVLLTTLLAMIGWLVYLHNEAEMQASRAEQAKLITDAANQMERDIFEIASAAQGQDTEESLFFTGNYDPEINDVRLQIAALQQLCKGDLKRMEIIDRCAYNAQRALLLKQSAKALYDKGLWKSGDPGRQHLIKELRMCVKGMVSQDILNIAREEKETAREAPEARAHFESQVQTALVAITCLIIGGIICIYLFFSFNFVRRLRVLLDNNMRLASGAPLNPIQPGDDEISDLDQAFHAMASALADATEKERAIIANAMDVIYSLDEKGTFVSVNDASSAVFGYGPDELIGNKFINIAVPEERQHVVNWLKLIAEGAQEPPFEMQLIRKDGRIIDIIWSAKWSAKTRTIFCVAHDLTERKQAERLRQEVVQMVSHDLKTPLSTVRSFLEMLEAGVFGEISPRGLQLLKLADMSTSRMLRLTKDLLDIEKMEAGMLQLSKSDVAVASVFEQVASGVSAMAHEQGVHVQVEPCGINIFADPDRLVQILTNLATNAIKFSPRGERVILSAAETNDAVEIRVMDMGRGIPEQMQSTIFDRFNQVRTTDATEKGGSGLGLAICKALVELHGGRITVQSQEGNGSTFLVKLPKSDAPDSRSSDKPTTTADPPALAT